MESGAVWLAPSLNPFLAEGRRAWSVGARVAHRAADQRGAPRRRRGAPRPRRRGDDAPAGRGRRLRRLLRQRAPRDQRRAHLPPRLRAAHPELEAPADRLPRPLRDHRRVGHRRRAPERAAQAPDRAGCRCSARRCASTSRPSWASSSAAAPGSASRSRSRMPTSTSSASSSSTTGRPATCRPGSTCRSARSSASRSPRRSHRGSSPPTRCGPPGCRCPARTPSRCPTCAVSRPTTVRARHTASTCTSRSTGTARSSRGRSSATCTGRRPRWSRT